jgi:mRNA-degrading endonuclease toxin of MazEF toxin-antitoxin module
MKARSFATSVVLTCAALAAGCADGNNFLSTASVAPAATKVAAAPKVDPACVALAGQIDTLRKDAGVERLEKAATGKGANVQVKRATLAKQTELNKANSEFQSKCGPAIPMQQSAQAAPQTSAMSTSAVTAQAASATATGMPQVKAAANSAAQTAVQVAPKN